MQQQLQVGIANLPINLILISGNAEPSVAFVRVADFKPIFDMPEHPNGISAEFHNDKFLIDNEEYIYNHCYAYKSIPSLLAWLQQQRLTLWLLERIRQGVLYVA